MGRFRGRAVYLLLLVVSLASLGVTVAAQPLGLVARDTAALWATEFAATGTFAAVLAALFIHRRTIDAEEERRHDAVRPLITVHYAWSADGTIYFSAFNDGLYAARGLHFTVSADAAGHDAVGLDLRMKGEAGRRGRAQPRAGWTLRPYAVDASIAYDYGGAQAGRTGGEVRNPTVLWYRAWDARFRSPDRWFLTCRYEDALGAWWRHQIVLPFDEEYHAEDPRRFWISLGKPEKAD